MLASGPTKIATTVLFSSFKTNGFFRFKSDFQLIPVPSHAPVQGHTYGNHPLLLEVSYESSSNIWIDILRRNKKLREVELLCACLLIPIVTALSNSSVSRWVYDPMVGETTSRLLNEAYIYPGLNGKSDDFTPTLDFQPMLVVSHNVYYGKRGLNMEDGFSVPSTFEDSLGIIDSLVIEEKQKLLRASYWYQYSNKAWGLSKSASFIALVSAVEALLPPLVSTEQCTTCSRPVGGGPTKQFKEFLDKYLPVGSVQEATLKEFYRIRSKLAHGEKLLYGDQSNLGFDVKGNNEGFLQRHLSDLVQIVIYNWLHAKSAPI